MASDLLKQVEAMLLPLVPSYRFAVVGHDESSSFDNATVVLQSEDLRLRIIRERGQVFADFGSTADLGAWFDSAVVMEYLGLSTHAGFHSRNAAGVLQGLAGFLNTFRDELTTKFRRAEFPVTKRGLLAVREARATARFGS